MERGGEREKDEERKERRKRSAKIRIGGKEEEKQGRALFLKAHI